MWIAGTRLVSTPPSADLCLAEDELKLFGVLVEEDSRWGWTRSRFMRRQGSGGVGLVRQF